MSHTSTSATLRERIATRRAEHRQHLKLQRELAAFTSTADVMELEVILDRYPDEKTAEVREILARQYFLAA